jgi:SAM-dependent methyltransferase
MHDLIEAIKAIQVSTAISPHDRMYHPGGEQHYYYVGRSDLLTLSNVLNIRKSYPGGNAPVRDIFDFGCGHGRVTRWLRAAFPQARLHVTDLDKTGTAFCAEHFSCADTQGEIPENSFDLIWLGSVFTHLPAPLVENLLDRLCAALRANGVLVFTSQGRFSAARMQDFDWENDKRQWMHYGLSRQDFATLMTLYRETGYGYVDYPNRADYGVSVVRPEWYSRHVLRSNHLTQILFQEKGSDNHQDISAFMRADIVDGGKGALW